MTFIGFGSGSFAPETVAPHTRGSLGHPKRAALPKGHGLDTAIQAPEETGAGGSSKLAGFARGLDAAKVERRF